MNGSGVDPGVTVVAAGSSHSVALLDCDAVVTWGRGEDGQLGHGDSLQDSATPRAVFTLLGKAISSICCGAEYTIAVSDQHRVVYSWGWGDFGRLGHGDSNDVFVPKPISFFTGHRIREVACGDTHSLIVTEGGELYAFGRNQNGQLGLGHTHDQLSPQLVQSLVGQPIASVAGGAEHTIAATTSGRVYGWGWGRYGNLGDGHTEDRLLPTPVVGLDGVTVVKVGCGWRHSVAVSNAGRLYTFGWSKYGQLGHGDNSDRLTPTLVAAFSDKAITAVAGGWRHTMAADSQGNLYAWGWNKFGQLGVGDLEDRNSPTPVTTLAGNQVVLLACGWRHTLAVTATGQVFTWGRGVNGQLGHGDEEDRPLPTHLPALSKGTLKYQTILATASPSGGYIAPADRYAVVPGGEDIHMAGSGGFEDAAVPDVFPAGDASGQGAWKKQRTAELPTVHPAQ